VEKMELSFTAGGMVKVCSHYEKQFSSSLIFKHRIPYDLAFLLSGIYPRAPKTCSHKNLHIAALFIIAKKWEQPMCPSTDG